jgi:hypothetical protein
MPLAEIGDEFAMILRVLAGRCTGVAAERSEPATGFVRQLVGP